MRWMAVGALALCLFGTDPALAQEDAEGCKDHPLFTRFPNMRIYGCATNQFDLRAFPVGPADPAKDNMTKSVEVKGPVMFLHYAMNDGVTPASGLQLMRNFENATKRAARSPAGDRQQERD